MRIKEFWLLSSNKIKSSVSICKQSSQTWTQLIIVTDYYSRTNTEIEPKISASRKKPGWDEFKFCNDTFALLWSHVNNVLSKLNDIPSRNDNPLQWLYRFLNKMYKIYNFSKNSLCYLINRYHLRVFQQLLHQMVA